MEFEEEKKEKLGLFKRLGIAIYNPKDYHKLADEKTGRTIGTFILVSLIQTICICVFLFFLGSSFLNIASEYIDKIPEFEFSKDGFVADMEEPFEYNDEDLTMFINIDSNKTIDEIKDDSSDKIYAAIDYVILGKDGVVTKNDGKEESFLFKDMKETKFDRNDVMNFVDKYITNTMLAILVGITGLFIFIFIAIFKFIGGLIFGLIGMAIASIQRKDIKFGKLYNIAMYAGVTTTIVSIITLAVGYNIPFWGTIKFIVICLYMGFGIKYMNDKNSNNISSNVIESKDGNKIIDEQKKIEDSVNKESDKIENSKNNDKENK